MRVVQSGLEGKTSSLASISVSALKSKTRALLGDTGKPVILTFAAIAEALGTTPVSAQTATWQLVAQDADVHARYGEHFGKPSRQAMGLDIAASRSRLHRPL